MIPTFIPGPARRNPNVFWAQKGGGLGTRPVPPPGGAACVMYWVVDEWGNYPDRGWVPLEGHWDEQCFTY